MSNYRAPIKDILFTLNEMVGWTDVSRTNRYSELTPDLLEAILDGAGKLVNEQIAPFNQQADIEGARFENGKVTYPRGWVDAWQALAEGGWIGLAMPSEFGGQGMPQVAFSPLQEMLSAGSLSFAQAPGLTIGAVEAIAAHGTEALKQRYIPRMASGECTGTMNLTEPQAGSDVGALRTRAALQADGSYKIVGQKIFITCGEQDFSENIVHLVLARVAGAPEGSHGISLFVVPKFLPNADGSLGEANDLRCTGIEHKLGLHGSSACSMSYGDNGGAVGWLVGEENKGLTCMFTMMNLVRLHIGLQGTGLGERAYQMALAYAEERVQGIPLGGEPKSGRSIIEHADVRRMVLSIRAKVAASRALCYLNAKAIDLSLGLPAGSDEQRYWNGLADLLTPLSKGYSSDISVETTYEALQVFGGMGFIEDTGIAQLYRDARITPIYEGTNGIQAWDLSNRKLKMDGGVHWQNLLAEIRQFAVGCDGDLQTSKACLQNAVDASESVAKWFLLRHGDNPRDVAAGSVAFQRLLAETVGAWLLLKGACSARKRLAAGDSDKDYLQARINLARLFAERSLPVAASLAVVAMQCDGLLYADSAAMLQSA